MDVSLLIRLPPAGLVVVVANMLSNTPLAQAVKAAIQGSEQAAQEYHRHMVNGQPTLARRVAGLKPVRQFVGGGV